MIEPNPEANNADNGRQTPRSLSWMPATPREESARELSQRLTFRPDENIGFFGKVANAFSNETVIGELLREMAAPNYRSTGYVVSNEDIERFAGDIDPMAAQRAAAASDSLAEFLYETDEIRLTEKRRKELFSGGPLGIATGLGLTLLSAGGEAVALSVLLGAAGTAVGGPAGGAAAAGGLAATRVQRMKGLMKAMGLAAAIDVPLETARYSLDKTLRPSDVMMALGASTTLSGALGAWKPHMFLREMQGASDVAAARVTAAALREIGEPEAAATLDRAIQMSVRVVDSSEEVDRLAGLKGRALFAEAKEAGVETHRINANGRKVFRSQKEIREDLLETNVKRGATPDQAKAQALRDTEGIGRKGLIVMARKIGSRTTGSAETIREAIVAKRIEIGKTGKVVSMDVPRLPKGLRLRGIVKHKGNTIKLSGTFEKVLWRLGTAKDKTAANLEELRNILKERGFEDPDAIAADFVKKTKAADKVEGKTFTADAGRLEVEGVSSTLEDGTVVTGFTRQRDTETFVDADILGREAGDPDYGQTRVATVDGQPVAEGPAEFVDEVAYLDTADPGQVRLTGHGQGLRETLARAVDAFPGDVPGLKWLYNFFAPVTVRMLRSNSEAVRKFATEFLENPRGGTSNVTTRARTAFENHFGTMRREILKAREAAREMGFKLNDEDIVRAVRSGEEFEGPLGQAVNAVRKYHRDVKAYGAKRGLALESIPDDGRYITRSYNHTAFTKLIDEFGEENAEEIFTQAILKHTDSEAMGVTEAKARAAARRIVNWGKDPEAVREIKDTRVRLDAIRKELLDDGISEEELDSFMELIVPKMETEPHLSFARRRIAMDEDFSMVINGRSVRVDEFFDNRLQVLTGRYGQRVIGGAEVRVGLQNAFGEADMGRGDLLSRVSEGLDPKEAEFVKDAVDHAYRGLTGMPLYGNVKMMRWIMGANAFGQATIGMTLGFAQIPEIASIIVRSGIKASFQQMPSLKEIGTIFTMGIRDVATGQQGLGLSKLKDDLSSVLETFTGVAGDYARGDHFMRRLDDMGYDSDYLTGGAMRYLEYGRQVSMLNPLGIMPMDTFLRRWAVRSSFQHFVNQAYEVGADGVVNLNKGFWKNSDIRFQQIGMSPEDISRLSKALKDPGVISTRPGVFGNYTVKDMDLTKVQDQAIFDKFAHSLRRHSDSMVQRQSFGETPMWMSTPVGKLLGQYRVFMMTSKSKQLAAGVARGDAHEAANVVGAAALGSLAYYMQTYYRSASMQPQDREGYLKDRLSMESMIKAGIMKSSYSSIGPMLVDTVSYTIGGNPVFDPSMRTTGLAVDPLRGSVPYSILYNRLLPAGRELTGAMFRGDEISKQDLRNDQALLWFLKVPGIDQGVNQFVINPLNIKEKD